jgi:AcrR family transcriptional regulator
MEEVITRKQEITRAAADLFRQKGYPATSMRDLAARVGLEPSSIYSHIKSKEDLLTQICMECAYKFLDGMKACEDLQATPPVMLDYLVDFHSEMAVTHPSSVTVFNDEWRFLSPDILHEFLKLRKAYETRFKEILIQGHREGYFYILHSDIVFELIIHAMTVFYKSGRRYSESDLKEQVKDFIIQAIKKDKK